MMNSNLIFKIRIGIYISVILTLLSICILVWIDPFNSYNTNYIKDNCIITNYTVIEHNYFFQPNKLTELCYDGYLNLSYNINNCSYNTSVLLINCKNNNSAILEIFNDTYPLGMDITCYYYKFNHDDVLLSRGNYPYMSTIIFSSSFFVMIIILVIDVYLFFRRKNNEYNILE